MKSSVNAYYRTQCHWRILLAKPLHVVRKIAIGCPAVSCGVLRSPVVFRHTVCVQFYTKILIDRELAKLCASFCHL